MKKILSFLMVFLIALPMISVFVPQVKGEEIVDHVTFELGEYELIIDGVFYTPGWGTVTLEWIRGSTHTFSMVSPGPGPDEPQAQTLIFRQWNDGSLENPRTVTSNGDATYYPLYDTYWWIDYGAEWGGSVYASQLPGPYGYLEGTQFTLTAVPDDGKEFSHWVFFWYLSLEEVNFGSENPLVVFADGSYCGLFTACFCVQEMPPSAPRNLKAESRFSAVSLSWQPPSDVGSSPIQEYRIYRGTSSGDEEFLISVDGATLNYLDDSVVSDKLYYYYVTAVNLAGESSTSEEVKCSSIESIKGIETVVRLDSFKTKGIPVVIGNAELFSIQQNFIIPIDVVTPINHMYLMQNVINVVRIAGVSFMYGHMEVWETRDSGATWDQLASSSGPWYGLQNTLVMRSTIEGETLIMDNNFWTFEFSNLPSNSWINTLSNLVDSIDTSPEVVPVGFGYISTPWGYISIIAEVDFDECTSGHVDCYVRIGSSTETWLLGMLRTLPNSDKTLTREKSTGLKWDYTTGNFYYEAPEYIEQGFSFEPNYGVSTVTPPAVPSHPQVPITSLMFSLHSPANLSLYDALGRHVGYNTTTRSIDMEIPNALYMLSENRQIIIVFNSSDTYELQVIGTGDGIYNLGIAWQNETGIVSLIWNSSGHISQGEILDFTVFPSLPEPLVVSWEYTFKDVKRGTMLKISTDDQYFQFIAPDKTFSLKYDSDMFVYKRVIIISYNDIEIWIHATVVDSSIDFCAAYAKDLQTGESYLLIDKPNWRGRSHLERSLIIYYFPL